MRTRIIKGFLAVAGLLVLFAASYVAFLRWPYLLFSHAEQFDCCSVRSDAAFSPEFIQTMHEVNERLASCELYRPEVHHRVFYATQQSHYETVASMARVSSSVQGFILLQFGNTFVSQPRIDELGQALGGFPPYGVAEGNTAHVIAHELVHGLTAERLGVAGTRRLPHWKREGYAEYASTIHAIRRDNRYSLRQRIAIAVDDSGWDRVGEKRHEYYRAAMLVEYLAEVRGLSFDSIMDDSVTRSTTESEMARWAAFSPSHLEGQLSPDPP